MDQVQTSTTAKSKSAILRETIKGRLKALAAMTEEATVSKEMQQYFEFIGKFHNYSFGNIMLILSQKPGASLVAGYRKWQQMDRQVQKGQKAIKILAPNKWTREKIDAKTGETVIESGIYFKTVNVFDISQTEGGPLPEAPQWITKGDGGEELSDSLKAYAAKLNITVLEGQEIRAQGESAVGTINLKKGLTNLETASTLTHELAHELMHPEGLRTAARRKINEWEAEAVSWVVLDYFGYKTNAPNYIALWKGNKEDLLGCMKRITKTSQKIIGALETLAKETKGAKEGKDR